ncbi:hypothetical protein BVX97_00450 [bacterium E08(2017)]|nr:hypothetical protein BVX97_00450 [bacterium E08(2017)]
MNYSVDYPIACSKDQGEFLYYVDYLEEATLVKRWDASHPYVRLSITPAGWDYLNGLQHWNRESTQAFIAMWFDESLDDAFENGIKKIQETTGYDVFRVDKEQFNEKICDRIMADIRKSLFLVADVTGHRQGVYFEAGFAMGLNIPVIWTCREDAKDDIHFDTRQYNHIIWSDADDLAKKLTDRIIATIGRRERS